MYSFTQSAYLDRGDQYESAREMFVSKGNLKLVERGSCELDLINSEKSKQNSLIQTI